MIAVSVVVPVHDGGEHLRRCLKSIQDQTLTAIEVVVVDDASTDGSDAVVEEAAATDARVRLVRRPHSGGAGAARNTGLASAEGEFVAFVDADDELEPQYAQRLYDTAVATGADVVVCGYSHLTATGVVTTGGWGAHVPPAPDDAATRHAQAGRLAFTNPAPWNKLFRHDLLRKHDLRFLETRSANDLSFTYSAIALADTVARLDEPLVRYRAANPQGISASGTKDPADLGAALTALRETLAASGRTAELRPALLALTATAVLTAVNGCSTAAQATRTARTLRPFVRGPGVLTAARQGLGRRRFAQLVALRVLGARGYAVVWRLVRGVAG